MPDPIWDLVPFGVDSWPTCLPYQRAGRATLWDLLEVERWAARAQLELELEIDRRFDAVLDRVLGTSWSGVE